MGQNLSSNDTSDETARYLHDGSVMGSWQADHIALFPLPEELDRRREWSILGDVQSELAYRGHGVAGDQDLGHAGSPAAELLRHRRVEVLPEEANVGKEQHYAGNGEDHRLDDRVRNAEALGKSI